MREVMRDEIKKALNEIHENTAVLFGNFIQRLFYFIAHHLAHQQHFRSVCCIREKGVEICCFIFFFFNSCCKCFAGEGHCFFSAEQIGDFISCSCEKPC